MCGGMMELNRDKVTFGKKPLRGERVDIPADLIALDFNALVERIEATGDQTGHELVAAQRERVSHATCTPCARNAATATLRVWLTRRMSQ